MATPEELTTLGNNATGWTAGILAALGAVRFAWLRISKDRILLAGDSADLDAMTRLKARVDQLDARLRKEESDKRKIAAFLMKVMVFSTQCDCDHIEEARKQLMKEYAELMVELEK